MAITNWDRINYYKTNSLKQKLKKSHGNGKMNNEVPS